MWTSFKSRFAHQTRALESTAAPGEVARSMAASACSGCTRGRKFTSSWARAILTIPECGSRSHPHSRRDHHLAYKGFGYGDFPEGHCEVFYENVRVPNLVSNNAAGLVHSTSTSVHTSTMDHNYSRSPLGHASARTCSNLYSSRNRCRTP